MNRTNGIEGTESLFASLTDRWCFLAQAAILACIASALYAQQPAAAVVWLRGQVLDFDPGAHRRRDRHGDRCRPRGNFKRDRRER